MEKRPFAGVDHGGVVIAFDARECGQRPNRLDARVGIGSIADNITETDVEFHARLFTAGKDRIEGFDVAVNI